MSVQFNFAVDLEKLKFSAMEQRVIETQGMSTVFEGLLTGLLQQKHPNGVKGADRKSFNRILSKLDNAEDNTIELEAAEVDLLKTVFSDETAVPPQSVRVFSEFEERVEQAAKASKE